MGVQNSLVEIIDLDVDGVGLSGRDIGSEDRELLTDGLVDFGHKEVPDPNGIFIVDLSGDVEPDDECRDLELRGGGGGE